MKSTFEKYLTEVYSTQQEQIQAVEARKQRLTKFPYSMVLELTYPQMDFSNWLCWQFFGSRDGRCMESSSEFPACSIKNINQQYHTHEGHWTTYWLAKTDYDFGFNEWLFSRQSDLAWFERFLPFIQEMNFYPDIDEEVLLVMLNQLSEQMKPLSNTDKLNLVKQNINSYS